MLGACWTANLVFLASSRIVRDLIKKIRCIVTWVCALLPHAYTHVYVFAHRNTHAYTSSPSCTSYTYVYTYTYIRGFGMYFIRRLENKFRMPRGGTWLRMLCSQEAQFSYSFPQALHPEAATGLEKTVRTGSVRSTFRTRGPISISQRCLESSPW